MASPLGGMRLAPAADGPGTRHPHSRECRQVPGVFERLTGSLENRYRIGAFLVGVTAQGSPGKAG
jgi:hypothetical protein